MLRLLFGIWIGKEWPSCRLNIEGENLKKGPRILPSSSSAQPQPPQKEHQNTLSFSFSESSLALFFILSCLLVSILWPYISLVRENRRIIIRRQMLITLNILQCSLSSLFSSFLSRSIGVYHSEIFSLRPSAAEGKDETQLKRAFSNVKSKKGKKQNSVVAFFAHS